MMVKLWNSYTSSLSRGERRHNTQEGTPSKIIWIEWLLSTVAGWLRQHHIAFDLKLCGLICPAIF